MCIRDRCGDGAFMEKQEDAVKLAELMVELGNSAGRRTVAAITEMGQPLGRAVGNSLEVIEAIETLKGKGPEDITQLAERLGGVMIYLGGKAATPEEGCEMAKSALHNGKGLEKLCQFIAAQGGNPHVTEDYSLFPQPSIKMSLLAERTGYIGRIEARRIGLASQHTGAGRATKEDPIDLSAGIYINKKVGDFVRQGESLADFYGSDLKKVENAVKEAAQAFVVCEEPVEPPVLVKEMIGL